MASLLKFLLTVLVTVGLFEFIGQKYVFEGELYFVHDVDHRLEPHKSKDINSDGIRSLVEADSFREEDINIIFLGDSFVYGYALDYADTPPQQLEAIARERHPGANLNVANFGWVSSSPLLASRLLRDIGAKYNPDVVILGLDMGDTQDDLKYQKLLNREGIYSLVQYLPLSVLGIKSFLRRVEGLGWLHEILFGFPSHPFFGAAYPMEEMLPYFDRARRNIDDVAAFSRDELGAKFALFVFPRNFQYNDRESPHSWEKSFYAGFGPYIHEPFRYFESVRGEVSYPIYSLLEDFQNTDVFPTCFDRDPHWLPSGARVAAEAIYNYSLGEGYFEE
jgi:hypothetical protein